MKEAHRQHGTILSVRDDDCDGRCDTVFVMIDFKGSCQGFGGYVLKEHRDAWNRELAELFGVENVTDIVGRHCWALRSFSGWNENIEGLETVDGKRFTAVDFFRRHLDRPVVSNLEKRRESIQLTIASLTRRINEETRELAGLEADYVEWTPVPSPSPEKP